MDIYEYIKADHKKVAHLFDLFEKTDDKKYKTEIVEMISKELLIHAHSEQATFYKALEKFPEINADMLHAEKEHTEIEEQIKSVTNVSEINAAWEKKVLKLKEIVEHHVKEEEGKIFDDAKKLLPIADAFFLKEQMHDYKEKILHTMDKQSEV